MIVTQREREREREAETQAEGEAGSTHQEPDVGFDPGSPGSRPGPKAGAKPLRHPGIPPVLSFVNKAPMCRKLVIFTVELSINNQRANWSPGRQAHLYEQESFIASFFQQIEPYSWF